MKKLLRMLAVFQASPDRDLIIDAPLR
jgi:hypothetical protein